MTVATEPLSETPALSRFETDVFATDSHLSARRGSSSTKDKELLLGEKLRFVLQFWAFLPSRLSLCR